MFQRFIAAGSPCFILAGAISFVTMIIMASIPCKDAAHCLVNAGINMVILDTPSPDREPFPIHHILLGNDVLIVENATNFSALEGIETFTIHATPAKFEASGAPVRVFATME